jgi:protein O-mannosyl-transferase
MPGVERGVTATRVAEAAVQAEPRVTAWRWFQQPWLPALVGSALYLNSLPNEFVYDDFSQVAENPSIRSVTNFQAIWLGGWTRVYSDEEARMHPNPDLLYRPLSAFSLAMNYGLHGLWPAGFRAVNIALHGLACLLVWEFLRRLFGDASLATWGALLFAVHPVHVEAVAYIVGRAEVLATVFTLLGLLVLVPRDQPSGASRAVRAMPLFFLALLSKETAISYVPVALIMLYVYRERTPARGPRWWGIHTACLLIPVLVYLPLRFLALGGRFMRAAPFQMLNPIVNADMPTRLLMPFEVLGHYTRLLLFPVRLSADYGYEVFNPRAGANAMTLLGLVVAAGLLVALLGHMRPDGSWRRVAICAALFVASYALFSNTLILIGVSVAERVMYWPSVAASGLLAGLALAVWQRLHTGRNDWTRIVPRLGTVAGMFFLVALAGRTALRNSDWRNAMRLFTHDAESFPESAQLNASAATECVDLALHTDDPAARRQAFESADQYAARALQHYPAHWGFQLMRSDILSSLGQAEAALSHIRQAVQLNPRDAMLRAKLGRRLFQAGQYAEALPYLEEGVQTAPNDWTALTILGEAQLKLARPGEALRHLENAVKLAPDNGAALTLLGDALLKLNEVERAIPVLEKAAAQGPGDVRICAALAKLLAERDPAAALRYAQRASELAPRDPGTRLLLADALIANGRTADGIELYREVLERLPADHPLRPQIESRLQAIRGASSRPSLDAP